MGAFGISYLFVLLVVAAIYLVPVAKIFSRAGWNPWTALLMMVPLVNIVMLWVFAYGRWPALKDPADAFS